jgi:hypothetical protein
VLGDDLRWAEKRLALRVWREAIQKRRMIGRFLFVSNLELLRIPHLFKLVLVAFSGIGRGEGFPESSHSMLKSRSYPSFRLTNIRSAGDKWSLK